MVIPIILSSDNNYSYYLYVTLMSILKNRKNSKYEFYLTVTSDFSKKNKEKIQKLENEFCSIKFIDMKKSFKNSQQTIKRIPKTTYYRLLAAQLIPEKYEKCIYLDVDVCVLVDLEDFYKTDLQNYYIGGVIEPPIAKPATVRAKELNIQDVNNYINAGVLLFNLYQIRKDNITEKFLNLSTNRYPNQDQDILNIVCYGKIKPLPLCYNVSPRNINDDRLYLSFNHNEVKMAKEHPAIIHYSDRNKPWNTNKLLYSEKWFDIAKDLKDDFEHSTFYPIRLLGFKLGYLKVFENKRNLFLLNQNIFYKKISKNYTTYRILFFKFRLKKKGQLYFSDSIEGKQLIELKRELEHKVNLLETKIFDLENYFLCTLKPLISVIMPVYNSQDFLQKTMQTLLDQTFINYEIICVNDGSVDNSLKILEMFSLKTKKLKIINTKNTGAGNARNVGLSHASGEYVIFLDSDDIFNKNLLLSSYDKAKTEDLDIVIFQANSYDKNTNITKRADWAFNTKLLPNKDVFCLDDIQKVAFQLYSSCPWNKLFKRSLVSDIKFQNIRNANDLFFSYVALTKAKKISYVKERLITYRVGNPNSLQRTKSKHYDCIFMAYEALYDYLISEKIFAELEQTFLNKYLESVIYYYSTIDSQSKELMQQKIKEKLPVLFSNHLYDDNYFYRKSDYEMLISLLN